MEAKVYSVSGKASSAKANLSDEVFGIEPNNHAIYLDVKQHLAIADKEHTSQKSEMKLQDLLRS